jgi:hypothetical protein
LGFELPSGLGFGVAEGKRGREVESLTVSEGAEDGGAAGAVVLEDVLGGAGRVDDVAAAGGGVPHGGRRQGAQVLAPLVISGELAGEVAVAVRGGTVEMDYCWVRGRGETVRSEWDGMGRYTGNRYPKLLYKHTDLGVFYPVQTM